MTTAWIPIWILGAPLLGLSLLSIVTGEAKSPRKVWIPIPNSR